MNALTTAVDREDAGQSLARVILTGDLSKLTDEQRVTHYNATCESAGLNPFTRPFEYLTLNGKMILYARKDCTDQLRNNRRVSIEVVGKEIDSGLIIVSARATMPDGRRDEDYGAVPLPANGEARANALMKAMTKAKRRVTLSICGLGFLDESELEGALAVDKPERKETKDVPNLAEDKPITRATRTDDTLTQQVAKARMTLPVISPATTEAVAIPHDRWLDAVAKALGRLQSIPEMKVWAAKMEPCFDAVREYDDALAHQGEQMVSGRMLEMAGPPDAEPDEPGASEPEEGAD